MLYTISSLQKILLFIFFSFSLIFFYNIQESSVKLNFEIQVIKSKVGRYQGQIYFSENTHYSKQNTKHYILHTANKGYQKVSIAIENMKTHSIRIDPLSSNGEVFIKNIHVLQANKIKLNHLNISKLRNIKVIKKTESFLHLQLTGSDPHFDITNNLLLSSNYIDYLKMMKSLIYALIFTLIMYFILLGFKYKYLTGVEILTAITLIVYTLYSVLYSNKVFANWLYYILPIFFIYILIQQGYKQFIRPTINIFIILITLSVLILIMDTIHDSNRIIPFLHFIKYMILGMIIVLIFIQKKRFNTHFYKYFLAILTISVSIFVILMQNGVIEIDRIITFGYKMSMSNWTQKNYTFWYLFLMWGSISFFSFNKNKKFDLFFILIILFLSYHMIMDGYSSSAKLAFIISFLFYILFSLIKFNKKILLYIPLIISLYIFFMPLIINFIIYLSQISLHYLERENIYTITTALIKEKILFGYGFKTSASILLHDYLPLNFLKNFNYTHIPAYNPHNIPLTLWINFGAFGTSLFSILVYRSMKSLILRTYDKINLPSLLALICTFVIITTFSWSGWWPNVFLTYTFFISIIFLSLNINLKRKEYND